MTAAPLPPNEQIELCVRAQQGDRRARDRLVETSMAFIVHRARRFRERAPSLPVEDFVQEGVLGLLQAIDRFEPQKGVRFITYAKYYVDLAIRVRVYEERGVRRSDANRMHVVRRYQSKSGLSHDDAITAVAAELGMRERTVAELVGQLRRQRPLSLDAPNDEGSTLYDVAATELDNPEDAAAKRETAQYVQTTIARMRAGLDERGNAALERVVSEDKITLREAGARIGVSGEWVRKKEKEVVDSLRRRLRRVHEPQIHANKAERRTYAEHWYKRRKKAGICVCGRKARPGKATCGNHRKTQSKSRQERQEALAKGRCPTHRSSPVEPGRTRCALCNQRKRAAAKKARESRRAAGLCVICGRAKAHRGAVRCSECRARRSAPVNPLVAVS